MSKLKPAFQPFLMLAPLGGLFLLSAIHMAEIHIGDGGAESRAANLQVKETIEARRGEILDVNGRVLATDRPVWELYVAFDPQRVRLARVSPQPGQDEVSPEAYMAAQLEVLSERLDWFSEATGLSRESLKYAEIGYPKDIAYYRALESGFTYAESRRLAAALKSMRGTGLQLRKSWERVYPQGRTFAHMLGFTTFNRDAESLEDKDLDDFVRVGMQGLERVYDSGLRGVDGEKSSLMVSADFGVNPAGELQTAVPGMTLHTTLDARIGNSMRAELATVVEEWGPNWCVALAMDVKTGALLGVVALPDFDCNAPGNSVGTITDANGNPASAYTFPAYTINPGSTVKPFVVAEALRTGAISKTELFKNFGGSVRLHRRPITNAFGVPRTPMTPAQALIHSSNVALVQIGLKMRPDDLFGLWEKFGYSEPIDLPVLGHQASVLPPQKRYHQRNSKRYTIQSVTFGSELGLTPLHHLSAWQGFLNDGVQMRPHLDAAQAPEEMGTVMEPGIARMVRGWLEGVVDPASQGERDGRKWLPRREGFRWGGKSGSADPDRDGKAEVAVFTAFGPIEDPEVVVLIIIERPDHSTGSRHEERFSGSRAAGVAAGNILMKAMELRGIIAPLTNLESGATSDTLTAHVAR
jgi:cell division protein FtsI (penicillin-binding protein 3)